MNCPECGLKMDFLGRYIVDVSVESAAPAQLKDFEIWRCDLCGSLYADKGIGELVKVEGSHMQA